MIRKTFSLAAVLMLLVSVPAMAGEGHKCKHDTQSCLNMMADHYKDRGWVGIEMDVDEDTKVMTITRVVPDSPAYESGFQTGDVLVAVNHVRYGEADEKVLKKAQGKWVPGQKVTYTVKRNGREKDLHLTLGELPKHILHQWVGMHMMEYHTQVKVAKK